MATIQVNMLQKLDDEDKQKVAYFVKLLVSQSKYAKLKEEISARKEEIRKGATLSHEEIWKELGV